MTGHGNMRWWRRWRTQSVAAKLYWVASLSAIAVAILAIASIHFARTTQSAAEELSRRGFEAVESSARLQSLLAQHRQIIESAPAEVDRKRLENSQREFIEKSSQLSTLLDELDRHKSDQVADEIEAEIKDEIPALVTAGQQVLFYAYNFAQDKALESSASYAKVANNLEEKVHQYRVHRIRAANGSLAVLTRSAQDLLYWVLISGCAAIVLIGPLGLTVTRGVLHRLNRITTYMVLLANETAVGEVPSRADRDEVGDMARAVQVFKDNATELRHRKVQLEHVNVQLDLALNNMAHGLCMFDTQGKMIVCNARFAAMYSLPEELTRSGTPLKTILNHLIRLGTFEESSDETMRSFDALATSNSGKTLKSLRDGRVIVISYQSTADGGWVAIHEDITQRQKTEAHIIHLARHDHLTDLPNRIFFREELDKGFDQSRGGRQLAVLCLDLDRFKGVNDTLGHSIGDKLLGAVAGRLTKSVADGDFVARLGGDEFAVIRFNLKRPEDCGILASHIIEVISAPYEIDGQQIDIGVSVGIAIARSNGADADELLKNADLAMYKAKADGRGSYRYFEPEMDARIQARRALELELRHAVTAGQLQRYYQPLVTPRSGDVRCFEMLLRWFHPRLGEIAPSEFIPLAEESGLIWTIGEWALRSACEDAAKWPKQIRVAVNLSAIQFRNANLVKVVLSALAASGLPASRLELEITESLVLEDDAKTIAKLHELRSLGIRIVMDDFGTGFSSLSYLRSFPFDKIKIDRSFIRDIAEGADSFTIVKAIIALARGLKIDVVAEGVETAEQVELLAAEGCTEVQGYCFSEPRPIGDFEDVLARRQGRIERAA